MMMSETEVSPIRLNSPSHVINIYLFRLFPVELFPFVRLFVRLFRARKIIPVLAHGEMWRFPWFFQGFFFW